MFYKLTLPFFPMPSISLSLPAGVRTSPRSRGDRHCNQRRCPKDTPHPSHVDAFEVNCGARRPEVKSSIVTDSVTLENQLLLGDLVS